MGQREETEGMKGAVRELTDLASHVLVAVTGIYISIISMYMVYVYRHH